MIEFNIEPREKEIEFDVPKRESIVLAPPYDDSAIKKDLSQLEQLMPEAAPVVGKVLKVLAVNEDGSFVCEWADGGSGGVTDVTIDGSSVVKNGIAKIGKAPAWGANPGVVTINGDLRSGLTYNGYGELVINKITDAQISARKNGDAVGIRLDHADKVFKAVMTDGKGPDWDSDAQLAGRQRLGLDKEWTLVADCGQYANLAESIIPVDLTGCTEIQVVSKTIGTSRNHLFVKYAGDSTARNLLNDIINNGTVCLSAHFVDTVSGIAPVFAKNGPNDAQLSGNFVGAYAQNIGYHISDIVSFYMPYNTNNATIDIKIYAR